MDRKEIFDRVLTQVSENKSKGLFLCNCSIDDQKLLKLIDLLKKNTSIRHLHLSGNKIGDTGCNLIAELIEANSTIEFIDLRLNSFNVFGARVINHTNSYKEKPVRIDYSDYIVEVLNREGNRDGNN